MNNSLPNFSAAIEAGLPEQNSINMEYNETDSTMFLNANGRRGGALIGALGGVAAGVGGALLAKDLINKNKRKKEEEKKRAEEQKQKELEEALAQQKKELEDKLSNQAPPETPPAKKNTLLYVGIGVGALVLVVGVIALARR